MNLPSYEDYEKEFLKAMAVKFEFKDRTELSFVQRLLNDNKDLFNKDLADVLSPQLTQGKEDADPVTKLRDCWAKTIGPKLAREGCDFGDPPTYKWTTAKKWLFEEIFPEWLKEQQALAEALQSSLPLTLDGLWQQLLDKGVPTYQMGPILADVLDMGSSYEECVRLGSNIRFKVNLDSAEHLLLLEKGTSGRVWCLCPSGYAPESSLPAGVTILPQEQSPKKSFKITGNLGLEQILAILTKNEPTLDWLPQDRKAPLELCENHLNELLEYLKNTPDCKILWMEYTITA